MNNINRFKQSGCYGCGVCATICPENIITIKQNADGFFAPEIVEIEKCINCQLCLKVCSYNYDEVVVNPDFNSKAYAVSCKDKNILKESASGGFAYVLSKVHLTNNILPCLVRYNYDKQIAEHYITRNIDELRLSQGSKYLPSFTEKAFREIVKDNSTEYIVVGCPCQIDSLRRLLKFKKKENKVLLVDFYCHGVPSYLMWKKYLDQARSKVGNIKSIRWRCKVNGWHNSLTMYVRGDKNKYFSPASKGDLFYKFFLGHRCLGEACYDSCKFKTKSAADIRIGDLWGTTYMHDIEGVSGVKILTTRGDKAFHKTIDLINYEEISNEIVSEGQIKECVKKTGSYMFVKRTLKTNLPLALIDKIATFIELRETLPRKARYYSKRIYEKLLSK